MIQWPTLGTWCTLASTPHFFRLILSADRATNLRRWLTPPPRAVSRSSTHSRSAADEIAIALALLSEAYEHLDERTAEHLEEQLFQPIQAAYGRAKRVHAGFAQRHELPGTTLSKPLLRRRRRMARRV